MDEKDTYNSHVEHLEKDDTELSRSPSGGVKTIDQGNEAVLFDISAAGISIERAHVKLATDGHTVLVPQPSNDPNDPLNWSWGKKHAVLAGLAMNCFVMEFSAGVGAPAVLLQGEEWNTDPDHVLYANNLLVAMMGAGAIMWIPTSYYWGRAPLLFWTNLIGTFFILGCALSTNFQMYYVFRALQGLFLTCGQSIAVALIKDIFFLHEQARKIGIVMIVILVAPSLGPQWANWMLVGLAAWRPAFWLSFAVGCFTAVFMLWSLDETFYRRDVDRSNHDNSAEASNHGSRISRVLGISQARPSQRQYFLTAKQAYTRLILTVLKPVVMITMIVAGIIHMWAVGIVVSSTILFGTPVADGGYGYSASGVACLFFVPIVGLSLGEIFGHFFNDWVARYYVRRHKGVFKPEARLVTCYVAVIVAIPTLILLGCSLQFHLNVAGIVFGWGGYLFSILVMAVASTAYLVDSYPLASAEISGLLTFARTISGFTVGYFQTPWGISQGYVTVFGAEAAICVVALVLVVVLQIWGARVRAWSGPLTF